MAGGAMGLAKGAFGMTPIGMAMGMLSRPARADGKKLKFRKRTVKNTISNVNGVMTSSSWDSDTATSIANFPITDKYGSTEGRSRPHGGVDIGTPVGTPVGFTEPGEILAAGEYGGYGNMMDVWLPAAKIQMRIAHLSKFVKKTGEFMAGEKLAETGGAVGDPGAGSSTGPHLHFEADNKRNSTRYGGAGNPMPYAPLLSFSAVEPPSGEGGKGGMGLGTSYGYPLTNTIKWPSSGGSMGGPSLAPSGGGSIGTIKQPMMIPIPFSVQIPVPVEVTKIISEKSKSIKAYGIDPFSGKYGEL
jgi:murein DD-endopeptidase MepM/ murein hydrolase activator NlpD